MARNRAVEAVFRASVAFLYVDWGFLGYAVGGGLFCHYFCGVPIF